MSLRIGTNLSALAVRRDLAKSQRTTERAMLQLASGSRFAAPGEDPASFSISEHFCGQTKGLRASRLNAENAMSFVQVAEGGLNEQNNILIRLRELAIQSASDTISDVERGFLEQEFSGLVQEVDRIAHTTQFGATKLLNGNGKQYEFQVGAYKGPENILKYQLDADTTAVNLGIEGLSVADQDESRDAIEIIDDSLSRIGQARASFGAMQSRLQSVVNNLGDQEVNIEAARSRMADTDVAEAVTQMTLGQIRQEYQMAVLSQANATPESALRLLS